MRTVIQMGLGHWAEYQPLSWEQNWLSDFPQEGEWLYIGKKSLTDRRWLKIPVSFGNDPTPFRYYGIDISPESIAYLSNEYSWNKNATWICVGVGNKFELTLDERDYGNPRKSMNSDRTNFLVMPFHQLLKLIDPPTFDILAVDIDGYEPHLIRDMEKWHIYPTFLTLELYTDDKNYKEFSVWHESVKPYGYELVDFVKHTHGEEWNLHECQYLRV